MWIKYMHLYDIIKKTVDDFLDKFPTGKGSTCIR